MTQYVFFLFSYCVWKQSGCESKTFPRGEKGICIPDYYGKSLKCKCNPGYTGTPCGKLYNRNGYGTGSRVHCGKPSSRAHNFTKVPKPIHSFFFIRMLFFRPRLNILIFLPILDWKYSCIILKLVYVFCGEYCTYVLHVPFIELSLALNILLYIASAGFFVLLASFAVQRKE